MITQTASTKTHKKTILMVLPAMPYPLRGCGEAIRYLPIIQFLSLHHAVDIIILTDTEPDQSAVESLATHCRRLSVIVEHVSQKAPAITKVLVRAKLLLPLTPPISVVSYVWKSVVQRLMSATAGRSYDVVLMVGVRSTLYAKWLHGRRVVVDFVDSPTLHLQRQLTDSFRWPPLHKYELWKMRRWEASVIRNSMAIIYTSHVDADAVPTHMTPACHRHIIPNGISIETYTPAVHEAMRSPNIGFLGNMAYPPNVDAAQWLFENVFRPLSQVIPDLTLYIIGKSPSDSVLALGRHPGVVVTGEVEEIWPYLNGIDVCVFPIWKGTGIKNKVLEAMYARRPVIVSPVGNEGIAAVPGKHVLVCDRSERFCEETLRLLRSPDLRGCLGQSGYGFVTEHFSWNKILGELEKVIAGEGNAHDSRGHVHQKLTGDGSLLESSVGARLVESGPRVA